MNRNSNGALMMDAAELVNLTTEVKETVAHFATHDKSFSVANLWNIQRGRKTQNLSRRPVLSRRTTIL